MSIIQTAKDLLRKGIALNDEELIQMANSLLTEQGDSETPVQPVKEEVEVEEPVQKEQTPGMELPENVESTAEKKIFTQLSSIKEKYEISIIFDLKKSCQGCT